MNQALVDQLLTSIDSDRLVIVCGAGLSMALPSVVPGSVQLAGEISAKYEVLGRTLPSAIRADLGKLAEFFFSNGMLPDLISKLVDWTPFRKLPNEGHEAIADFLACGVVEFVLTTNFDSLVEESAAVLGEPNFQGAIKTEDLTLPTQHQPYVKIHGCLIKEWGKTVWCESQLTSDVELKDRITSLSTWLSTHLHGRDVLLIGFWTDWDYLHMVLESAISKTRPNRVVLVDRDSATNLERKAPALWEWATRQSATFHHERESGAKFLSELRKRFSLAFFAQLLSNSCITYSALSGGKDPLVSPNFSILSARDLFAFRRDSEGLAVGSIPRNKRPDTTMSALGALHFAFASKYAALDGNRYFFAGKRYRLVQGAGRSLSEIKTIFEKEPPEPVPTDVVVCAGAIDDGCITSVIRTAVGGGIIRPGSAAKWITTNDAFTELSP